MAPPTLTTLPQELLLRIIRYSIKDREINFCRPTTKDPGTVDCTDEFGHMKPIQNPNLGLLLICRLFRAIAAPLLPQAVDVQYGNVLCAHCHLSIEFKGLRRRVSRIIVTDFQKPDHTGTTLMAIKKANEEEARDLLHWLGRHRKESTVKSNWELIPLPGPKKLNRYTTIVHTGYEKYPKSEEAVMEEKRKLRKKARNKKAKKQKGKSRSRTAKK